MHEISSFDCKYLNTLLNILIITHKQHFYARECFCYYIILSLYLIDIRAKLMWQNRIKKNYLWHIKKCIQSDILKSKLLNAFCCYEMPMLVSNKCFENTVMLETHFVFLIFNFFPSYFSKWWKKSKNLSMSSGCCVYIQYNIVASSELNQRHSNSVLQTKTIEWKCR